MYSRKIFRINLLILRFLIKFKSLFIIFYRQTLMYQENYLVFDIETTPLDFESFSESQREYLLRNAATDEEKQKKLGEMALTPLTGKIICIGMQMMTSNGEGSYDTIKRLAYAVPIEFEEELFEKKSLESGYDCYLCSEQRMLEDFWKILKKYENCSLVSFNGRNFDAPYVMLRSALLGIRPYRNIMAGTKFNYPLHIDLIDELTYYSPSQYGATKRFNFDFYTRAFGITSPKSEGIDGSKVTEFYKEGKILDIAEYCLRDVKATWELFCKWKELLKF